LIETGVTPRIAPGEFRNNSLERHHELIGARDIILDVLSTENLRPRLQTLLKQTVVCHRMSPLLEKLTAVNWPGEVRDRDLAAFGRAASWRPAGNQHHRIGLSAHIDAAGRFSAAGQDHENCRPAWRRVIRAQPGKATRRLAGAFF
jgi:hypothetical protein